MAGIPIPSNLAGQVDRDDLGRCPIDVHKYTHERGLSFHASDYLRLKHRTARAHWKRDPRPVAALTLAGIRKDLALQAIPYFEKSIEKDSTNPLYHYHLGLACAKTGDAPRARRALERALKLRPDFPGAPEGKRTLARLSPNGESLR